MIIWVDRPGTGTSRASVSTEQLDRSVGDYFVRVHICRGARAGLKYIDDELIVEFPVHTFAGRSPNRLS